MSHSDRESESDLLESLIKRHQEGTADHLDRRMREAQGIKEAEEASSQRRLEAMWEKENQRQREIAAAAAEQQRREKQILRYALTIAAIVIVAVILLSVVLGALR